jgi:toxin ParE1/3/4
MSESFAHYDILLTQGAEQDLESIYDYWVEAVALATANEILDQLLKTTDSLSQFPERGSYLKELAALGIQEYRQVSFNTYRVIYRVQNRHVIIYAILDGRRDIQSLLSRRLLGLKR